jgi:GntR family transcriptional regulator/MocR family aminotransferase
MRDTSIPRTGWEFGLDVSRGSPRPLFIQIAAAIVDDILRGRLRPGDALPGTRVLAASLGVNRITVLTAYDELAAEGWITIAPARGAYVSNELPEATGRSRSRLREVGLPAPSYPLPPPVDLSVRWPEVKPGVLALNSAPDMSLLCTEPLLRAYRRILRRGVGTLLAYGPSEGHAALRTAIARMLSASRAIPAGADEILITQGSQMALSLVARALLRRGDTVAVEGIGYPYAWQAFALAGATLAPVPVDADGLDVEALARLTAKRRINAVYVTPHHQFPTTVTLSAARRVALLELAAARRFVIIEDDYDDGFHYEGGPVLPLASLDRAGVVVYVGTFSKIFAPGIRIGYVAAHRSVIQRLAGLRAFTDIQGDHTLEAALADLIEDGELQRHVRRVRQAYRARRDLFAELLRHSLGSAVSFDVPRGGVALWAGVAPDIDVDLWLGESVKLGVSFLTAKSFTFERRPGPFARLGFASQHQEGLRAAVAKLAAALPRLRRATAASR